VRYAEACVADWDGGRAVRFAIRDRNSRELLGVVGLDSCVHLHRSCELGYWLRRDATGKGLMTEAANATVEFAFARMAMHRIRCAAATDNFPSLRVIQRLGFKFEGIARQAELVQSRWLDHAVFAKLSQDE
jgi:ribosomal-protein-serine acetyltransferase